MSRLLFLCAGAFFLSACEPTLQLRDPYPTQADVCRTVAVNELTQEYAESGAGLIACPSHEQGAIADRKGEGAVAVGAVDDWVILRLPLN